MNDNQDIKKNYFWIDLLKAIAAFAVILLHVSVPLQYDISNQKLLRIGVFYNSMVRFCVPIFVMVSGVLLLSKTQELGLFLRKRFSRIIYPFLFWSCIYLLVKINYNLPIKEIVLFSISQFRSGTEYHLWYIYMLIGLYLFIPILSKWIVGASKKEILYFLSIWLFILLLELPGFVKLFTRIDFRYFSGYIGYLVLGTFLHRYFTMKSKWFPGLLVLGAVMFTFFTTYFLTIQSKHFIDQYINFLSVNVALAATGVFLLCKDMVVQSEMVKKIITVISKYSYGIYLSHVFILIVFGMIGFNSSLFNPWIGVPVVSVCCLVTSFLLTFSLSKIPVLGKHISG